MPPTPLETWLNRQDPRRSSPSGELAAADRLLDVTSSDEALARLAAAEVAEALDATVQYLEGGNTGWVEAGHTR